MNADRRIACDMIMMACEVATHRGSIKPEAHSAIGEALKALQQAEYWALRGLKPERNESSARQHAIATIALQALEEAVAAWDEMDYETLQDRLYVARFTEGKAAMPVVEKPVAKKPARKKSTTGLRKRSG